MLPIAKETHRNIVLSMATPAQPPFFCVNIASPQQSPYSLHVLRPVGDTQKIHLISHSCCTLSKEIPWGMLVAGTLPSGLRHVTITHLSFAEGPSWSPRQGLGEQVQTGHIWLRACVPSPSFSLLPVSD